MYDKDLLKNKLMNISLSLENNLSKECKRKKIKIFQTISLTQQSMLAKRLIQNKL